MDFAEKFVKVPDPVSILKNIGTGWEFRYQSEDPRPPGRPPPGFNALLMSVASLLANVCFPDPAPFLLKGPLVYTSDRQRAHTGDVIAPSDLNITIRGWKTLQCWKLERYLQKNDGHNALLHYSSSHPPKLKNSIPIGQFLRARRICSSDITFHQQAKDLERRFRNRGYPAKEIKKGYLLHPIFCPNPLAKKTITTDTGPRFITKFNSNWAEINQILKKHWPVLLTDRDLHKQLTPYPSITWRKSQNLADTLCRSHYIPLKTNPFSYSSKGPPWGCFPCGNCSACRNIIRTKEFSNSKGDKTYKSVHHITCNTEAIIYHISCPCGLIYIRMTTRAFKIRIQEHVRDIKNAAQCLEPHLLKNIPKHFLDVHACNPKGMIARGIDHVYSIWASVVETSNKSFCKKRHDGLSHLIP
ncbi:unnamed protein product [Ranitomeya imitator]|uniref:Helix-turn-helix domain-containing protein n=1 Tax=Ranitomeya imitator TaxID=111125 RepID=A0ABN9M030_9NEOB|nr:unnamed protein product [Ranitomeya imitator]